MSDNEACEACVVMFNAYQLTRKLGKDEAIAALDAVISAKAQGRAVRLCPLHQDALKKLANAARQKGRAL